MTSKFALLFPGQGSQSVGMLSELAAESSVIENTFAEASDGLGYDLWDLVQNGTAEALNKTTVTQPALLTSGVAIWRLWKEKGGVDPDFLAGHSLGEYTALVVADVFSLAVGAELVKSRGEFMQQAVQPGVGAMAAIIGLDNEGVEKACAEAAQGEVVAAVNYNAPGQVVIAGLKSAIDRAIIACKDAGAKRALPLTVSVPSHCALMDPAAEQLRTALESVEFKAPRIAVINNVDAKSEQDSAMIKEALVRQLYSPVQWVACVEALVSGGVERAYECGPGKVLSGLNKRIAKQVPCHSLQDLKGLTAAIDGPA
ncbi:MAG: [acyl-carrier-protein] S-malonyltransferase [Moraxellaceae bacterium]|nr:MAG: [acyl-carrier-protein] S-malonyltransferase [Moraxellaceae bacterium]